jgi:hypothetical protein
LSKNSTRLVSEFKKYFQQAITNPKGKFKSYVLKQGPKTKQLIDLLQKHDIQIHGGTNFKTRGFNYQKHKEDEVSITDSDYVINADQPKSVMLQILMDPEPKLEDSVTYDITAWALPYAYGVECYGVSTKLGVGNLPTSEMKAEKVDDPQAVYAAILSWDNNQSAKVLSALHNKDIKVRIAREDVMHTGQYKIGRGSVVVTKFDNPQLTDFYNTLSAISNQFKYVNTGMANTKGDLGGSSFDFVKKPKVLSIMGDRVSNNELGHVWHFFDEVIEYPLSMVYIDRFANTDLADYNVIILPDGYYNLSTGTVEKLSKWVQSGGRLIALGGGNYNLVGKEGFSLKQFATDDEKKNHEKEMEERELKARLESYGEQERKYISSTISGAIICNHLDKTHPLSFGLGDTYHSLKVDNAYYNVLKNASNPVYIPKDYKSLGFIGADIKQKLKETVTVGAQSSGRGSVVYILDNPLFRGFWKNGEQLFSNALFMKF